MLPDQTIFQSLYEVLASFLNSTHSPYDIAKDFQPAIAAAVALLAVLGAYFAARLGYRANLKQIELDKKKFESEQASLRLGHYFRLRSQCNSLFYEANSKIYVIDRQLKEQQKGQIFLLAPDALWVDGKYDELDIAWENLELFPPDAFSQLDDLRERVQRLRRLQDRKYPGEDEMPVLKRSLAEACLTIWKEIKGLAERLQTALDIAINDRRTSV